MLNVQTTASDNSESVNSSASSEMHESDSAGSLSEELLDLDLNFPYFEYQQYAYVGGDITTDALEGAKTATDSVSMNTIDLIINFDSVTLDKVLDIEGILQMDEKVSLIYLLYENVSYARDEIKNLLLEPSNCKPVYEWAREKEETDSFQWKKSLVEALCIIQDYRILRTQFGYEKSTVNDFYYPFNKSFEVSVNKIRKVFYLIFDNLPSAKVREVFVEIKKDPFFSKKPFKTPQLDGSFYFELYLLDLEHLNYISRDNVKNLARIFKKLDLFAIEDEITNLVNNEVTTTKTPKTTCNVDENFEKEKKLFVGVEKETKKKLELVQDNINQPSLTQEQQTPSLPSIPSEDYYEMNVNSPGIALIINNEYFFTEHEEQYKHLLPNSETSLQDREGTEADLKALKSTFKHLNFSKESIIVKQNRRHKEILQDVRDAANKVTKEHSSLFVTILTHGEKDIVYGANSCKVDIQDIDEAMATTNVANLMGKPKVLFLQCCQGKRCQTLERVEDDNDDYETDSPETKKEPSLFPKSVDHFRFCSTVPGYSAIRHKSTGTWFIQTLCHVLNEISDIRHLDDMCTEVINRVTKKVWRKKGLSNCMVPLKWSTLRMKLYLPPMIQKNTEANNVQV